MKKQNKRVGFTLIEILIVVVILAILAYIVIPPLMEEVERVSPTETAIKLVREHLQLEEIKDSKVILDFQVEGSHLVIFQREGREERWIVHPDGSVREWKDPVSPPFSDTRDLKSKE